MRQQILLIMGIIVTAESCLSSAHLVVYNQTITAKGSYYRGTVLYVKANKVNIEYDIQFRSAKCCPFIGINFSHNGTPIHYSSNLCYKNAYYMGLESLYFISSSEDSGCKKTADKVICKGRRELLAPSPQFWVLFVGYLCIEAQPLNLTVILKMQHFENAGSTCVPFHNEFCQNVIDYNQTAQMNLIGQSSKIAANTLIALIDRIHKEEENCYQYSLSYFCRIIYPECHGGTTIYPCFQSCKELFEGCAMVLKIYLKQVDVLFCTDLVKSLDQNKCYYEPVICPPLQSPLFGKVVTSGHALFNVCRYSCNMGFEMVGDAVRTCTYSGSWNGTAPICKFSFTSHVTMFVSLLLVLILALLYIHYRRALQLFVFHNLHLARREMRLKVLQEQNNLFITFSSQDLDEVNDEFLPRLKQELPRWKIQTYQQDFAPGRPLLSCIHEGVWESQAMLVLLTENYVASPMCRFEFIEATTRSIVERDFKVIVIIFVKDGAAHLEQKDLPEQLRKYIRTHVHLIFGEQLFWYKLRKALHRD